MQIRITWSWILRLATLFQFRLNGHWYTAKMKVRFKWECTHNQSQDRVFIPRNYLLVGVCLIWRKEREIFIWLILKCLAATNILKKVIWNSYVLSPAVKFLIISLSYDLLRFISISCTCNKLASLLYIILLFPVRKCKFAKSCLSKSTSYIFKYVREEEPLTP